MYEYYSVAPYSDELYHWGVKGQKWGVRRYQNKDGSLTDLGKKRLSKYKDKEIDKAERISSLHANSFGRRITKYTKQLDKAKMSQNPIAIDKASDKLGKAKRNLQRSVDIGRKEIERIKHMSFKDMQADISATRKDYAKLYVGGFMAGPLGVTVMQTITGNPSFNKTERRTGESWLTGWE